MKIIGICLFTIILFGCSNRSEQSAFTGQVAKQNIAPVGTISSESLYQIPDTFATQDGKKVILSQFSGEPTVVGMIFTHCTYACPRLTADIKNVEEKLGKESNKVNFLLVSFDSERDLPSQLKQFAESQNLDNNWTLLHGNEDAVRTLSVLLNVQFQKDASGNFSHSNVISVLDKNGVLAYQKEGLNGDPSEIINTLKQLE